MKRENVGKIPIPEPTTELTPKLTQNISIKLHGRFINEIK